MAICFMCFIKLVRLVAAIYGTYTNNNQHYTDKNNTKIVARQLYLLTSVPETLLTRKKVRICGWDVIDVIITIFVSSAHHEALLKRKCQKFEVTV